MIQQTREQSALDARRRAHHPDCFVCGQCASLGLGVRYEPRAETGVEAKVTCPAAWEGYAGLVHGGVIASLLDGAMTNCLFAMDIAAVTADLQVRYRHPVRVGVTARITASAVRITPPLFVVEASITQDRRLRVTATGKFMQYRDASAHTHESD